MSFREISSRLYPQQRPKPKRGRHALSVQFQEPLTDQQKTRLQPPRPIVLYGGDVRSGRSEDTLSEDGSQSYTEVLWDRRRLDKHGASREIVTRKSTLARLTNATLQFQKMVADLEHLLKESGESPEMAWRAKILLTSAQYTDKELWKELYTYERTLLIDTRNVATSAELRTAQTACMKLHRDFKRIHKTLVMVVSLHEKRQSVEISRLGAVGWSEKHRGDEDFFDKAMRQDEIDRMNRSMHKVNDIYKELGQLVEVQQEDIDLLEDTILDSKANVEAADWEFFCAQERTNLCARNDSEVVYGDEETFGCGMFELESFSRSINMFIADEARDQSPDAPQPEKEMRVSESFHCMMPFETITEDMKAVQADIMGLGNDLASQRQSMECGNKG
ncbi:predicted protein [Phaeodactylum tricornutum CCAP 1055/1]|jgi:hypothetical protein|uniref:t-SNARE coiled-coil homology domain-containing protein n=2 Tax=Phaeodactylum tricornutum TaxID=2850 RepID=B7FZ05_PHATC|nr:predicted protein [Phaeodactylum tricornutum CCAP 1055/1]EEC48261.1 predicted protein [Phaeodactylum tricornutum CCAP 1055/1]|eukprot:XP_002180070.1 predicted protein [Phaeodactylum tricornutum CCAP 1055/1]